MNAIVLIVLGFLFGIYVPLILEHLNKLEEFKKWAVCDKQADRMFWEFYNWKQGKPVHYANKKLYRNFIRTRQKSVELWEAYVST